MKNQENRNRSMNSVISSIKCENPYLFPKSHETQKFENVITESNNLKYLKLCKNL